MKNNMQRVIGNIVILTPVIVGLVFYNQLPNQIAIHFNVEEQANGFMNRNLAIVALPFLASIIYNLCFSFFKQITIPFLKEFMLWLIPIFSPRVGSRESSDSHLFYYLLSDSFYASFLNPFLNSTIITLENDSPKRQHKKRIWDVSIPNSLILD
jgi:hypothetical protein